MRTSEHLFCIQITTKSYDFVPSCQKSFDLLHIQAVVLE